MTFMTRDHRARLNYDSTPQRGLSEAVILMELGRDLRSLYAGLVNEPMPEHLACILRKLEEPSRDTRH